MSIVAKARRVWPAALVWLFYLGVLLLVALPKGLNTTNPAAVRALAGPFSLWADTDGWIRAFGPMDPASYARGGREILTDGWVEPPLDKLWPPGPFVLHALIQRLQAPIPLSMIFVSCCLWSCTFLQFFCFARRRLHPVLAAALPLALLGTDLMRDFFLHGWGPYLSEGPGCPLLIMGFGFLVRAFEPLVWPAASPGAGDVRRTLKAGCYSGLCFALAAYFRGNIELVPNLLTLAFVATALVLSIVVSVQRRGPRPAALRERLGAAWWKSGLIAVFAVLASFHAGTLPYRLLYNYRTYGSLEWVPGLDYMWPLMWRDPAVVPREGRFFVEGGGQAPAIVAPDWHVDAKRVSPREAKALVLKLIRQRPGAWLRYKLPILARYWFSRNCAAGEAMFGWSPRENGLILLFLLAGAAGCVAGLFRARFAGTALWMLAFIACVAVASVGPSMLLHFEARYLYPLKILGLFLPLYGLALVLFALSPGANGGRARDAASGGPAA